MYYHLSVARYYQLRLYSCSFSRIVFLLALVCVSVSTHTRVQVYVLHTHTRVYIDTRIHVYIHIHIKQTFIYKNLSLSSPLPPTLPATHPPTRSRSCYRSPRRHVTRSYIFTPGISFSRWLPQFTVHLVQSCIKMHSKLKEPTCFRIIRL